MCLEVSLKLSALAKSGVGAERLSAASGLLVVKGHSNLGSCLHFSETGPCSCDLMQKGAKQIEERWLLKPTAAESLARAIAFTAKEAKSFTFQARWLGDELQEPRRIKLAELLEAVRSNRIPKNTPLLVGSHP
jgi:hypothetical protein